MSQSTPIIAGASGNTVLVAAVPGRRIRVVGLALSAAAAVGAQLRSGTTTPLTGGFTLATGVPLVLPAGPPSAAGRPGWFETAEGEGLNLNLSGAVAVAGVLLWETR